MIPIFNNTEVSLKNVRQHMQEYAKHHDIKDVPLHLLISSYFGKKIGLATPLLKWYLEHGLIVTCIYTVIKYVPNAALKDLPVQVAKGKLHGDRNPWYALTAEMRKLEGNASYGTLITNKEKHHDKRFIKFALSNKKRIFYKTRESKKIICKKIPIHCRI